FRCQQFLSLSVADRCALVGQRKLCFNSLRVGHISRDCAASKCKRCNGAHNTLLHQDQSVTSPPTTPPTESHSQQVNSHLTNSAVPVSGLLPTAVVKIQGHECRALLDSGSEASFISEALVQHLH